jgi:hypothetical protein
MARANRYYILGCVAIGREVMEADRGSVPDTLKGGRHCFY